MSRATFALISDLRDTPCDAEPFTPSHAACRCRIANAAADEIERLRKALQDVADNRPNRSADIAIRALHHETVRRW